MLEIAPRLKLVIRKYIKELQHDIRQYRRQIADQKKEYDDERKNLITSHEDEIQRLEKKNKDLEHRYASQKKDYKKLKKESEDLRKRIADIEKNQLVSLQLPGIPRNVTIMSANFHCQSMTVVEEKRLANKSKGGKVIRSMKTRLDVEKKWKCDECCRRFTYQTQLLSHKDGHKNAQLYPCHFCSKTYKESRNRQFHIQVKHPKEAEKYLEPKESQNKSSKK